MVNMSQATKFKLPTKFPHNYTAICQTVV